MGEYRDGRLGRREAVDARLRRTAEEYVLLAGRTTDSDVDQGARLMASSLMAYVEDPGAPRQPATPDEQRAMELARAAFAATCGS